MNQHECPLCGRQMYPLEINGGPIEIRPDSPWMEVRKRPDPVYFQDKPVTLYACELCGYVKMIKENPL